MRPRRSHLAQGRTWNPPQVSPSSKPPHPWLPNNMFFSSKGMASFASKVIHEAFLLHETSSSLRTAVSLTRLRTASSASTGAR